jgi:hypothetical protein
MQFEVKYYLRDKLSKKLSQPFNVLECAMMYCKPTEEIYEVWVVNKPMEEVNGTQI